jgi:hypothetical protein
MIVSTIINKQRGHRKGAKEGCLGFLSIEGFPSLIASSSS